MNHDYLEERLEWAQEQLEIGNFGRVEKVVEEVLRFGDETLTTFALRLRAIAQFQQGQIEESIETLNTVLANDPENNQALYVRTRAYMQVQDLLNAAADAEKLAALTPEDPYNLELLIEVKGLLGHFNDIVPLSNKVLEVDPESSHIYATRGHAYLNLGKYDEAIRDFEKMLDEGWDNEYVYTNLGFTWSKKGDYKKAVEYFDEALAHNPRHAPARSHRGFALFKLGDADAGLKELNLSITLNPDSAFAYRNRALILLDMGEREEAREDLLTAKELDYHLFFDDEVDRLLAKEFGGEE